MSARIFTVPPGEPFLLALARAILNGDLPSPGGAKPDPLNVPRLQTRAFLPWPLSLPGAL